MSQCIDTPRSPAAEAHACKRRRKKRQNDTACWQITELVGRCARDAHKALLATMSGKMLHLVLLAFNRAVWSARFSLWRYGDVHARAACSSRCSSYMPCLNCRFGMWHVPILLRFTSCSTCLLAAVDQSFSTNVAAGMARQEFGSMLGVHMQHLCMRFASSLGNLVVFFESAFRSAKLPETLCGT